MRAGTFELNWKIGLGAIWFYALERNIDADMLIDLGGNDGGGMTGPWLAPWELPNTITCGGRPTVVSPPPPSQW